MVLRREIASEDPQGGKGHFTGSEEVENQREPPAGSGGRDTIARGVFGEAKRLRAIGVEGPVAFRKVDGRTCVEHGQMGDELDRRLTLLAGERAQTGEEVLIGEGGCGGEDVDLHDCGVSRSFSCSG